MFVPLSSQKKAALSKAVRHFLDNKKRMKNSHK